MFTFDYRGNFPRVWNRVNARDTVIVRATEGVVPPDTIPMPMMMIGTPQKVLDLVAKFKPFSDTLQDLPPDTSADYKLRKEANSKLIWDYAKKQAADSLIGKVKGFTGDVNIMFDPNAYASTGTSFKYTEALQNARKVFSRGAWAPFWDAISIVVQSHRDKEQRIDPALGITPEEFDEVKSNLVYISQGYAYSAKTTQSEAYINGTSVKVKREDAAAFQAWVVSKSLPIVKIVRLNVSDIPFGYAPKEIQAFEKDPTSATARLALEKKLLSLQKEALSKYRAEKAAGTASGWSFEDWLAAK